MMKDASNYDNPLEFDPEGHFDSNVLNPSNFMGFGQGPRGCIGMRLAYVIVRIGLFHTLAKFKISRGPKTKDGWYFNPVVPGGVSHNDVHVKLENRN